VVESKRLTHHGAATRIENSFCSNVGGAYVITDKAMTRCSRVGDAVVLDWEYTYDNGYTAHGESKFSGVTGASGTTPTLAGDYVVIGDAAKPMNVVVLPQALAAGATNKQNAPTAKLPVFANQAGSECENSIVAFGGTRLLVGNTYGYANPLEMFRYQDVPGLTCLKLAVDGTLALDWARDDLNVVTSPPKASRRGVLYMYTRAVLQQPDPPHSHLRANPRKGRERWELVGVDITDGGRTVYRVPVFEGAIAKAHDNAWATMCLGEGVVYLGMWHGALRIGDS
jgi:hypothetical protein